MTDANAAYNSALAALRQAEQVLADLERDKGAAVARQTSLATTREKLALAGITGGAAADRKALADATTEAGRIGLEIQNFDYAIAGAEQQVAAATAAVDRAVMRGRATAALGQVAKLRIAGSTCARALSQFVQSYSDVFNISAEVRRTGIGRWPRDEVFALAVRRSIQFALYTAPGTLNTEAIPVPSSRRELEEILARFTDELEISLRRALDEPAGLEAAE